MSIVVNTKTYANDVPSSKDSQPYLGPAHTLSIKDKFDLFRTAPRASKEFSGMARSRARLVRTVTLTGALTPTGDITIDVNINVPVGAAGADVDTAMTDFSAALAQSWAKDLAKNLDILA